MQLSLQARVMKKVCGCLFLFFSFFIFFICSVFVLIEINVPVCLGDVCFSLFLFGSYVPKEKKKEKKKSSTFVLYIFIAMLPAMSWQPNQLLFLTSSGHPLPFITNIIHKLPLFMLCKEMLTSQACQLDNGVKWASVTVTTSFMSERTFYFWVYHLDIADLRTHINCA